MSSLPIYSATVSRHQVDYVIVGGNSPIVHAIDGVPAMNSPHVAKVADMIVTSKAVQKQLNKVAGDGSRPGA